MIFTPIHSKASLAFPKAIFPALVMVIEIKFTHNEFITTNLKYRQSYVSEGASLILQRLSTSPQQILNPIWFDMYQSM